MVQEIDKGALIFRTRLWDVVRIQGYGSFCRLTYCVEDGFEIMGCGLRKS